MNFFSFWPESNTEQRELAAQERLFWQGDEARFIFLVERGRVRLLRHLRDGRTVAMQCARSNESIAEAALFSQVYHCEAVAEVASIVRLFPKKDLLERLNKEPALALAWIQSLTGQVRELRSRLEVRDIISARERVWNFLLLKAEETGGSWRPDRPLKEIASELGLAHETFYRQLASLEKENLIERGKNRITLLYGQK